MIPKTNTEYWVAKFETNAARDSRVTSELIALDFDVLVLWECELADKSKLVDKIKFFLDQK